MEGLYGRLLGLWEFFPKLPLPFRTLLQRCEDTYLSLKWEKKSHFMVKEALSSAIRFLNRVEVDKAKSMSLLQNTSSTTGKGIRSFLGEIAPMGLLLRICFKVIDTKGARTTLPIIVPDWKNRMKTVNREKVLQDVKPYFWDETFLFKIGADQVIRRCARAGSLDILELAQWTHRGTSGANLTAKRSLTPVSSGPPSIKMPRCLSRTVTRANVKEKLHNVMRCLKTPSKFVKSLTCGASTLWARSRLTEGKVYSRGSRLFVQIWVKRKRSHQ
ncbi:hypothetical protein Tco_1066353 [Tanacetum coccineum]|uniref:Uncharacterized protein n=1 Tax=Tanacetum coccineum TaxID=301880 RepID=A0ABQ5H9T0_9ASTR